MTRHTADIVAALKSNGGNMAVAAAAEIDAVADLHREDVRTMTKSDDRDVRVMAIRIANLKAYQINLVRRR